MNVDGYDVTLNELKVIIEIEIQGANRIRALDLLEIISKLNVFFFLVMVWRYDII